MRSCQGYGMERRRLHPAFMAAVNLTAIDEDKEEQSSQSSSNNGGSNPRRTRNRPSSAQQHRASELRIVATSSALSPITMESSPTSVSSVCSSPRKIESLVFPTSTMMSVNTTTTTTPPATISSSSSSSQQHTTTKTPNIEKLKQQRTAKFKGYVTNLFSQHALENRKQLTQKVFIFDYFLQFLKSSPKAAFIKDIIVFPIAAGLLMHGPGLEVKLSFEDWSQYFESLVGAAIEGVFLLLLGTAVFHAGYCMYGHLQEKCSHPTANYTKWGSLLLLNGYIVASVILAAWSFNFILSSILGDATFRLMTGNDSPSAEVLQAWSGVAKAYYIVSQHHEPFGAFWRLVFGMGCLVGSVWIYVHPLRKQWKRRSSSNNLAVQQEKSAVMDGSSAGDSSSAVEAAMRDVESRFGEADKTSATRCSGSLSRPKSKVLQLYIVGLVLGCVACYLNIQEWYTPVIFSYVSVYFGEEYNMDMMSVNGMTQVKPITEAPISLRNPESMVTGDYFSTDKQQLGSPTSN
eukprot:CAMPEP_0172313384 /NCGR_PEP_ID=MMETSP1058-20130122/20142_1 /TAXON_ID=83371 /ORGANISM="Detonula confervacea, Strain CCMP 353" /LENGTH=516 /DNA_ID=CAMNT_0013027029 /DNA_START=54 /DNA_END=1604 /DNA_ORIENTATION=-